MLTVRVPGEPVMKLRVTFTLTFIEVVGAGDAVINVASVPSVDPALVTDRWRIVVIDVDGC